MFQRNGRCGYVLKPEALRIREVYKSAPKRLRFEVRVTVSRRHRAVRMRLADSQKDRVGAATAALQGCVARPRQRGGRRD
jgi:hypothetical protein